MADSEECNRGPLEWFTRATANDGFELWSGTTIIEGRTHTLPAGTGTACDSEWFVRVTPTDTRTGADALSGTPVESPVRTVQNTIPPALDLTVTVLEDSQTTITLNTADPDPGDTPRDSGKYPSIRQTDFHLKQCNRSQSALYAKFKLFRGRLVRIFGKG